ncbi:hypothetical protein ARMSODRAFT_964113 [Armillaria solidipes]|uniref:Uncharacterized protein n=1 Tax=Armillaria solidipes TaxID=1076256 RepID=A0A2H3AUP1_9AGAR|nr:hypothetical protein ARMSODRAFT_964113 [Armillaria solidipes]
MFPWSGSQHDPSGATSFFVFLVVQMVYIPADLFFFARPSNEKTLSYHDSRELRLDSGHVLNRVR